MSTGEPKRHNIDHFTLIKKDGVWKFLTVPTWEDPPTTTDFDVRWRSYVACARVGIVR